MAARFDQPLPFTVLGGFLGSGKTTLLNRLLTETKESRFAVLVNDFGELNIDQRLVVGHDGKTIALANGCMCCSMADGFISALSDVMDSASQFDHMVVEASGVSNPRRIMDIARLDPGLMPNGSIVLVDTPQILLQLKDPLINDAIVTQLAEADVAVINKVGLTDEVTISSVQQRVESFNPDCPTIINDWDDLHPDMLFGSDRCFDLRTKYLGEHPYLDGPGSRVVHVHDSDHFRSCVLRQNKAIDRNTFNQWVESLPSSVIRGKGFITLSESPDKSWLWQKVGRSTLLEGNDSTEAMFPAIVLIGTRTMPGIEDPAIMGPFSTH